MFHGTCIDQWTSIGGDTCPMCRNQLAGVVPKYRVTVRVENTETNNTAVDEIITEFIMESFHGEIDFEANTSEELHNIIRSLGFLRGIDLDSLVFNTEGAAVF